MFNRAIKLVILLIILFIFIIGVLLNYNNEKFNDYPTTVSYIGFGSQGNVGGSLHMLNVGKDSYLIDAGIFYGDEGENYPLPDEINVEKIKAILITHAHSDHIGRLPLLLEEGYKGPIYMTPVTKDITLISLVSNINYMDMGKETFYYSRNNTSDMKPVYLDRFSYGQYEVKPHNRIYVDVKREELNKKGLYLALSTREHLENELIERLNNQIKIIDYNKLIKLNHDLEVEFLYTSHLPGSSMIKFNIAERSIIFSGDIGSDNSPFLSPNKSISEKIDYLFLEGTYGSKIRETDIAKERLNLRKYIGNAIKANQRVIIPAFAVDRTQQVIYEIKVGMDEGLIPKETTVKVYSPTSEKVSELYKYYSNNKQEYESYFTPIMFTDIFNVPNLIYNPRDSEQMYNLNIEYGEISIMTSGMISSGFSQEIASKYIEDENTHFISVSYQDPAEIGGQIFRGETKITIDEETYEVKSPIFSSPAFSGHANIEIIFNIFKDTQPEKIFLVHLNDYDSHELKGAYTNYFLDAEVTIPKFKEEYFLFSY